MALMEAINERAVRSARREAGAALVAACMMSADEPYASQGSLDVGETTRKLMDQARVLDQLGLDLLDRRTVVLLNNVAFRVDFVLFGLVNALILLYLSGISSSIESWT
ncbi:MAG: hypothetical protein HC923_13325 [Myxococcales bacterium]|nr:hypothetical protein [Myxococcales bacterium]